MSRIATTLACLIATALFCAQATAQPAARQAPSFDKLDINQDRVLDEKEAKLGPPSLSQNFDVFDEDHSGTISSREYRLYEDYLQ